MECNFQDLCRDIAPLLQKHAGPGEDTSQARWPRGGPGGPASARGWQLGSPPAASGPERLHLPRGSRVLEAACSALGPHLRRRLDTGLAQPRTQPDRSRRGLPTMLVLTHLALCPSLRPILPPSRSGPPVHTRSPNIWTPRPPPQDHFNPSSLTRAHTPLYLQPQMEAQNPSWQ